MGKLVVIDGDFSLLHSYDGDFRLTSSFQGELGSNVIAKQYDYPIYDGQYDIDPLFAEQVLQTREKCLLDDLTVKAISVSYVSNPQGGQTAYIGGEFVSG